MIEIREIREQVPCGEFITTQYIEDGQIVRQDCRVLVDKAIVLGIPAGLITAQTKKSRVFITSDDEHAQHP